MEASLKERCAKLASLEQLAEQQVRSELESESTRTLEQALNLADSAAAFDRERVRVIAYLIRAYDLAEDDTLAAKLFSKQLRFLLTTNPWLAPARKDTPATELEPVQLSLEEARQLRLDLRACYRIGPNGFAVPEHAPPAAFAFSQPAVHCVVARLYARAQEPDGIGSYRPTPTPPGAL